MESTGANVPQTSGAANGQETANAVQENFVNDLLYLKNVVVSNENLDEVRKILEKTRKIRDEMIKDDTVDYLENFPVLFVRPLLVCVHGF